MTSNLTAAEAIADIRIEHNDVEIMVRETVKILGECPAALRLREEANFHLRVCCVVRDLVTAILLAQTLSGEVDFALMLPEDGFAGGDEDLQRLGQTAFDLMNQTDRFGETGLHVDLIAARLRSIRAAI